MRTVVWILVAAVVSVFSIGLASQQPATPTGADKPWAFPLKPDREQPETEEPRSVPGSTRKYSDVQIGDLFNPPDWFPDKHPTPPEIVVKGHDDVMACGACHLMSGLGHPESSDLTGLTADYIVQQLMDFKSGARIDPTRMNGIAKGMTEEEMRASAEYFAALPRQPFNKVIEQATVPETYLGNGRMRFVEPGGGTEPIGNRIITVPEDEALARLRHPTSGFISYVPPGSLARGKELVETGGGTTLACGICHGTDMKGLGTIPRLAGMHPIYTVRQLYWFKDGTRNGAMAAQMTPVVAALTDEDILAMSAYLGSLTP